MITRNQRERGRVSGEEKRYDREGEEMLGVGGWGGRGRCLLYLLHQFQLNSTGALVNKLEVQQETEEPLERVKRAFMECDTLLANTYAAHASRLQHHTLAAHD